MNPIRNTNDMTQGRIIDLGPSFIIVLTVTLLLLALLSGRVGPAIIFLVMGLALYSKNQTRNR